MTATVKAPAKINFTLDITGRLENGYHSVDMVMQAVNLYDIVTVNSTMDNVTVTSNWNFIPTDERNTAFKAAKAFFKYTGINGGADIHIEKHIPVQAGLAGGSSDGAAVIVALNHIYKCHLAKETMCAIGAMVGSDVPFCIRGGIALATGTGTDISPIWEEPVPAYIVLCKPQISVSTAQAYSLADQRKIASEIHSTAFINAYKSKEYSQMFKYVYNDFESLLKLQDVEDIKKQMLALNGCLCSCMTGSGSVVYGVFDNAENAEVCKNSLLEKYKEVFVVQPVDCGCIVV